MSAKTVNMEVKYFKTVDSKAMLMKGLVRVGGVWVAVRGMFVDYTQAQMMRCLAHITMNASLSHYLYIMATTPRRGQASSRLINPLTARPKEK